MRITYILLTVLLFTLISGCVNPLVPSATPSPTVTKLIEPEVSANLSVGYQKVFAVTLDSDNYIATETHPSTFIYRFTDENGNTTIYVDENSSLLKVIGKDYILRYKNPVPLVQYPLHKGENWYYASPITFTTNNSSVDGQITINGTVKKFENATIFGNTTCQTVVVKQITVTSYTIDKTNYSISNESTLWYGQNIGLVKSYTISKRYIDTSLDQISEQQLVIIKFRQ
jgi:hypothetical protein